jgi:hypothetical protein
MDLGFRAIALHGRTSSFRRCAGRFITLLIILGNLLSELLRALFIFSWTTLCLLTVGSLWARHSPELRSAQVRP